MGLTVHIHERRLLAAAPVGFTIPTASRVPLLSAALLGSRQGLGGFHGGPAPESSGQPLPPRSVQVPPLPPGPSVGAQCSGQSPGLALRTGDAATSQCLGDSKRGILGPKGNPLSPAGSGTRIVGTLGLEVGARPSHQAVTAPSVQSVAEAEGGAPFCSPVALSLLTPFPPLGDEADIALLLLALPSLNQAVAHVSSSPNLSLQPWPPR